MTARSLMNRTKPGSGPSFGYWSVPRGRRVHDESTKQLGWLPTASPSVRSKTYVHGDAMLVKEWPTDVKAWKTCTAPFLWRWISCARKGQNWRRERLEVLVPVAWTVSWFSSSASDGRFPLHLPSLGGYSACHRPQQHSGEAPEVDSTFCWRRSGA